jgi:hypothetical protein
MNFGLSASGAVHYYIRYTKIVRRYKPKIVVVALHDNDVIDSSEFSGNDLTRPILTRELGSGEITGVSFAHASAQSSLRRLLRKSAIYRFIRFKEQGVGRLRAGDGFEKQLAIYLEPRDAQAIESERQFHYWTLKLADAIRDDGADPLFVYLPAQQCVIDEEGERVRRIYGLACDYSRFEKRLTDWMNEKHLRFYSFTGPLREQDVRRMYLPGTVRGGGGTGHLASDGTGFVASVLEPILSEMILPRPEAAASHPDL